MKAASLATLLLLAGCAAGGPRASVAPPPADGIPLGALPRQALGKGQCGLFLWSGGAAARLVLVANSGPPPVARILLDGRVRDLPRIGGAPADALADATASYGDGTVTAALDLAIERREGLSDGAVARGTIRVDRAGGDGFAVPVSGLLACA